MKLNEELTRQFETAAENCARCLALIDEAIEAEDFTARDVAEQEFERWHTRMEVLSGLRQMENPHYDRDIKEYARKVADWIRLDEAGLRDPDMAFPSAPSRFLPF